MGIYRGPITTTFARTTLNFSLVQLPLGIEVTKVKFNVVTGNSEENKKFFYLTPYGTIEFGTINPNIIFTPGKEYTVTFSE